MAKCVIVSSTRICTASPYRVNGKPKKNFPTLSARRKRDRLPARRAINALSVDPKQRKLANDLLDAVLAVSWDRDKAANAKDIVESVQLLLVDELPDTHHEFTLVAY